jgi:hypothetical protein
MFTRHSIIENKSFQDEHRQLQMKISAWLISRLAAKGQVLLTIYTIQKNTVNINSVHIVIPTGK